METKKLMIDMDNVITDGRFLDYVDEFLGTNYIVEDMKGSNVLSLLRTRNKEFWEWVKDKDFYEDAPLLDGCYEVLKDLYENYELYIVTAYLWDENIDVSGYNLMNKYYYLRKMLPFIDPSRFIFISNKDLLKADVKIDDKLDNLNNCDVKILFNRWHNRNVVTNDAIRVDSWNDIRNILL